MLVEQILIEKKVLDLPPGTTRQRFIRRKGSRVLYSEEQLKVEKEDGIEIEEYEVIEIKSDEMKRIFLVRVDDRALFSDLINLGNSTIQRKVMKATRYVVEEERFRIKRLSWWRRLLNRF